MYNYALCSLLTRYKNDLAVADSGIDSANVWIVDGDSFWDIDKPAVNTSQMARTRSCRGRLQASTCL